MKILKPALFLDRDGVVNKNHGYVFKIENFEFYPEIFEICLIAKSIEIPIVIVTNQSGIGRGYFSESDYQELTHWMVTQFLLQGITINKVVHASENPEAPQGEVLGRRKPSPAMILEASKELDLDIKNSIMIGDNESDMISAERAGISNRILIGKPESSTVATEWSKNHKDCLEILKRIIARN